MEMNAPVEVIYCGSLFELSEALTRANAALANHAAVVMENGALKLKVAPLSDVGTVLKIVQLCGFAVFPAPKCAAPVSGSQLPYRSRRQLLRN